jgi:hypothetical protein
MNKVNIADKLNFATVLSRLSPGNSLLFPTALNTGPWRWKKRTCCSSSRRRCVTQEMSSIRSSPHRWETSCRSERPAVSDQLSAISVSANS